MIVKLLLFFSKYFCIFFFLSLRNIGEYSNILFYRKYSELGYRKVVGYFM